MIDQVSNEYIEVSEGGNAELFKASALGFVLVLGYIVTGFVTVIYLLWLITNIYELLVGLSIFYLYVPYLSVWIGLIFSIGFLAANILVLFFVVFIIRIITKAIKNEK